MNKDLKSINDFTDALAQAKAEYDSKIDAIQKNFEAYKSAQSCDSLEDLCKKDSEYCIALGKLPTRGPYQKHLPVFSYKDKEKLIATAELMAIAHHLNGNWTPNWENHAQAKWALLRDIIGTNNRPEIFAMDYFSLNQGGIVFCSIDAADQAIAMMGEERLNAYFGIY